jgi:hypothetical protein
MTASPNVTAWPPMEVTYTSPAIHGVNNDGDAQIDEDTSDDDGDHAFDEDPIDGFNNDTDALINEDPPLAQCTLALCDDDADGLIDEDPSCLPLFPTLPMGACVASISFTIYTDTDGDGCGDERERGPNEQAGGRRDPLYFWDFYDVWVQVSPGVWTRDKTINVVGDVLGVASRFGATRSGGAPSEQVALSEALAAPTSKSSYHAGYDRGPLIGPNPWDLGPPDGEINVVDDILGVARQFSHSCF